VRKLGLFVLLLAAIAGGLFVGLRGPVQDTVTASLRAYPVYMMARTRSETRLRAGHAGEPGLNRLIHRPDLAGPRDRWVTTPNNDTLYSSAHLDLKAGPVKITLPALPDRYHSVAVMDARTDNVIILGTRDGGAGGCATIEFGDGQVGKLPPEGDSLCARYRVGSGEAWLLVRVLVDGAADLPAARAAQQGFVLEAPAPAATRPPAVLPVLPDPATLLRATNPVIAETPMLQDPALAATGFGGAPDAFEALPIWRQWLWRLVLPRVFQRMKDGVAAGSRITGDGWSRSPPGIGTAEASDEVRAAVALGGLGALPKEEAVYWSATLDADGADLDSGQRYRLTIPADVPARAFWSLSLYERLPDGRLFYVANPLDRYAVGNRMPDLIRNEDGSLTLLISAVEPDAGNWLPAPRSGPFTLVFRAYLPEAPILEGRWRLPPVERLN
jgi:hypothetical protein